MRRHRIALLGAIGVLVALPSVAVAHGAGLRGSREAVAVPTWLFLATGGAVVGASFLLASLVTDRQFVNQIHTASRSLPSLPNAVPVIGAMTGIAGLGFIFWGGVHGPPAPRRNVAILIVWVGWWPGFTMTTYLLGNSWPAVDPVRRLARLIPITSREYPDTLGAWPATVGLLGIIFLEVVSPLASKPTLLAGMVAGYVVVSAFGGACFGAAWFRHVDPLARAFRTYGNLAPIQRNGDGLSLVPPGAGLVQKITDTPGGPAFVVALLWGTTYDGMVSTPTFGDVFVPIVRAGLPPVAGYLAVLGVGFGIFLTAYRGAIRLARRTGPTFRSTRRLGERFVPTLIPIAAGYHFAHYFGDLIALSPAFLGAITNPLKPPAAHIVSLPNWFGITSIAAILLGHLIAIAAAHAVAYDTFPSRLQAVRAQVPLTAVMVAYTVVSLWIVTRPNVTPPYL